MNTALRLLVGQFFRNGSPFRHLLVVVPALGVGCSTLKQVKEIPQVQPLNAMNLSLLNGNYAIISKDTSYRTLSFALLMNDDHNFLNLPDSNDHVRLEVVDDKHITVTVVDNGSVIASRTLTGSVKEDRFTFNTMVRSRIWVVWNELRDRRARIGLMENGSLTVDVANGGSGLLILFPVLAGDNALYGLEFVRL